MSAKNQITKQKPLSFRQAAMWLLVSCCAFHVAFVVPSLSFLIVLFLCAALQLVRLPSSRFTFYCGLALGFSIYGPHLGFFWRIFGPFAIALWDVVSLWLALFLVLARGVVLQFGVRIAVVLVPIIWLGLEYFRSELYYLRFSWLSPGFAFSRNLPWPIMSWLGVHGVGLLACFAAAAFMWLKRPWSHLVASGITILFLTASLPLQPRPGTEQQQSLRVAGVQLEFQPTDQIIAALDKAIARQPHTDLFALSEYTFTDELPVEINNWCRKNGKHLIVGAKDRLSPDQPVQGNSYHNTAFVIDPNGDVVFRQAKSVPIQFFQDGQPAPSRAVWHSPWGRIGIGVCYDLSYSRVMDDFVRLGAELLIIPTMDVVDWGEYQHQLHSRVAPIRAAEYGLPIFRLSSSGVSQSVDASGHVRATAPFPGQGEILSDELTFAGPGRIPIDRFLAMPAVVATALAVLICLFREIKVTRRCRRHQSEAENLDRSSATTETESIRNASAHEFQPGEPL